MRTLLSMVVLMAASAPAFAEAQLPEPELLTLLAMGAVGLLLARRKK